MAELETILFDVKDRVATITLNRPERKNAMNQALKDELRTCWQRVKLDADIWVAIITGAGDAFSSGADVEGLATGGFTKPNRWAELAQIEGIRELPTPRRQLVHKPVIAAVNGVVARLLARPGDRIGHPDRVGQGLVRGSPRLARARLLPLYQLRPAGA